MKRTGIIQSRLREELAFFVTALSVVIADQLSKLLIRVSLSPGQSIPDKGFLRLTYVTNTGGVFGLFSDQTFPLILTTTIGVVAFILYYRHLPSKSTLLKVGLGLAVGGAVGNLVDRLCLGYVIDFLDLRIWPVFNLADSAIVTGIGMVVCFLLFSARRQGR